MSERASVREHTGERDLNLLSFPLKKKKKKNKSMFTLNKAASVREFPCC